MIKQVEVKKHKGRAITPKGKSFLDKLAKKGKEHEKVAHVKEEQVKEHIAVKEHHEKPFEKSLQGKEVVQVKENGN